MSVDFYCVFCRKPIKGDRRLSTRYCGRDCRNSVIAARRKDETLRRRNEREMIVTVHADWIRNFCYELLALAPPEAGGYQAGLWTGNMTYWFPCMPAGSKYRNTLLRTKSQHSFFSLHPFEPPTVPLIAYYEIRFVQKIPPHPVLPMEKPIDKIRIPYEALVKHLPFNLRAVPRDLR